MVIKKKQTDNNIYREMKKRETFCELWALETQDQVVQFPWNPTQLRQCSKASNSHSNNQHPAREAWLVKAQRNIEYDKQMLLIVATMISKKK